MQNQTPIISVNNVKRSFRSAKKEEGWKGTFSFLVKPVYQTHEALKGVSFQINPGEFVGLIGANGAGKTTLLKILSGLIPPTSGTATVMGFTPFERKMEFRRKIALVMGQKAQLWWDLPAADAFQLIKAIYDISEKDYQERLGELADLLEVKKLLQTQIRRLSLGERMKMELIGAILHWPKVIFLDEPTIGLDVLAAHNLREFLKVFNQKQKATIILTSHNMDDIEKLCPRTLIIREGSLIFDGAPSKLIRGEDKRLKVRLIETPSASELGALLNISPDSIEIQDDEESSLKSIFFSVKQDQIVQILERLMKHYKVVDMGLEEPSLESAIQHIYQEQK